MLSVQRSESSLNNSDVESWATRANPEVPFPTSPISTYPPPLPTTQHIQPTPTTPPIPASSSTASSTPSSSPNRTSSPSALTFDHSSTLDYANKDVIACIKMEHRLIKWLFLRFRDTDDNNRQQLTDLLHNIIKSLSTHLFCEEFTLYGGGDGGVLVEGGLENGGVVAQEMVKEHFVLKGALYKLQELTVNDEGLRPYVAWLYKRYAAHADKEEADVSAHIRDTCTILLGESM